MKEGDGDSLKKRRQPLWLLHTHTCTHIVYIFACKSNNQIEFNLAKYKKSNHICFAFPCKLNLHVWLLNFLTFCAWRQHMARCAVQPSEKRIFFNDIFLCICYANNVLLRALFVWVDLGTCTTVVFCASFVNLRKENMQIICVNSFHSCCRGSAPDRMSGGEEGEQEEVLSKKEKRRVTIKKRKNSLKAD